MKNTAIVSAGIVIPVYKPTLTEYEHIALTQCMRVLGTYPVWLAAPESLDISLYRKLYPILQVRTFADRFFTDIQAYNKLMLSEEFYKAFTDVEYILIHQLDAFVFRDELADWCKKGYDYIGAPWLRDRDFTSRSDELWFNLKKKVATLLDLKKPDGVTPKEIISLNGVGNGGLSLRRIPAMLRWLHRFERRIERYERIPNYHYNEDIFWGIEINRYWPLLRIPDYQIAMRFAIEFYPKRAVEHYNNGQLPFGCHAWDIHGTDYWRPIFAQYGYQI
ncbi:DUF5672 family protein [Spirosoma agri]|uniref:DUF5672 domain-containing protein n=1 Tax=Spirosoma agri TaxID=1987381 RepID=A0A6M0IDP5_9BACT|nr:DUF5672 family protein [Spirosoma agri]NEU66416.1 hypothetical protein [Spirosoma agri]